MNKNTILQFGEGNFLRCFVDWMIDIMNERSGFNGEVVVVQPQPGGLVNMLKDRNNSYHTYLLEWKDGKANKTARKIACIKDALDPYSNFDAYLAYAKNPDLTYIISNTTEAGIAFSDETWVQGQCPLGFPAKLTAFLYRRYQHFGKDAGGLTLLPCELIEHNADQLKDKIIQTANHWSLASGFTEWVETQLTFCNTLVDRIVPGFPKHNTQEVWEAIGEEDPLVTTGEGYHLWVIEGGKVLEERFPAKNAGLNVVFTDNLQPYRDRKVRILNGVHTAVTSLGLIYGIEAVHEVFEHQDLATYLDSLIFNEIVPSIDRESDGLKSYAHDIINRFKNPLIRHELASISLNSVSKFQTRLMLSHAAYTEKIGKEPKCLVFAYACLIYRYLHQDPSIFNDTDEVKQVLRQYPASKNLDAARLEALTRQLWKEKARGIPQSFYEGSIYWYQQIKTQGIKKALASLLVDINAQPKITDNGQ